MEEDTPDNIPRRSHSAANIDETCHQKRKGAPEHCNERGLTEDIATKEPLTITIKEPTHHNYRAAHQHTRTRKEQPHCSYRYSPTTTKEKTSLTLKWSSPEHHNYKETPKQQIERSCQPQLEKSPPPKLERSHLLHLNRTRCLILEEPRGPTTHCYVPDETIREELITVRTEMQPPKHESPVNTATTLDCPATTRNLNTATTTEESSHQN